MANGVMETVSLQRQANPGTRSTLKRWLLIYTAMVLIAGWVYATWYLAVERERAFDMARGELRMTSAALRAQMEAVLGDGLGSAQAALSHLEDHGGFEGHWLEAGVELAEDLTGAEYVRALFLSSANRTVVAGREGYRESFEGRPSWLADAAVKGNALVGTSFAYPTDSNLPVIPIAVARQDAAGERLWVGLWLGVPQLNQRYAALGIEESVISLVRWDGTVIAHSSRKDLPSPEAFAHVRESRLLKQAATEGSPQVLVFQAVSSVDGKRRIFAVSRLSDEIPLLISVSRDVDSILSGWHQSVTKIFWLSLVSSIVLLALTTLLYRYMSEVSRRETQFQLLFENSLASILMLRNGRVIASNGTAARVFRVEQRSLLDLTPLELSASEQAGGANAQRLQARWQTQQSDMRAITFRWLFKRMDDGSPFEADVHLSTIHVAKDTLTLAIIHDISELETARRELQLANQNLEQRVTQRTRELQSSNAQLAAANRELEQFSASASHDLRSPLGSIGGQAGMLEAEMGEVLGEKGRERLRKIEAAVKRASDVVDGLLSLSRIARQELLQERMSLSALAIQIIAELRDSEPGREVDVQIQSDMWVDADPRLMHSLLVNLLSNAWKYTADRSEASISMSSHIEGDEMIYEVRDNGVGFDMAYAEKMFKAFERLPGGQRVSGIGLGLPIVARIVTRYGGRVWAQGEEGVGATFHFTLPLAQEAPVNEAATQA